MPNPIHPGATPGLITNSSAKPWIQRQEGIEFKLLRASPETGTWTVLYRCAAGARFNRHYHLGAGEYFVVSGRLETAGGEAGGGITALPGDYGFEYPGCIHDDTWCPEPTIFLFTGHGALNILDNEGNTLRSVDCFYIMDLERAAHEAVGYDSSRLPPRSERPDAFAFSRT